MQMLMSCVVLPVQGDTGFARREEVRRVKRTYSW